LGSGGDFHFLNTGRKGRKSCAKDAKKFKKEVFEIPVVSAIEQNPQILFTLFYVAKDLAE
jgi:hypothetical protein